MYTFRLLVSPAKYWSNISPSASPTQALVTQFVLLALGRLIAWQPISDLIQVTGGNTQNTPLVGEVVKELLLLAVLVVAANVAFAGVISGCGKLVGIQMEFRRLLLWLSYGLIPISLGYLVGTIPLWFIQPLSTDLATALAWQIKPFSLGLASFFPNYFTPLSAQWFIASTFDFFGCWTLLLLAIGAIRYFGYDFKRSAWITCGLVLVFFLTASVMWQVFQALLVSRG